MKNHSIERSRFELEILSAYEKGKLKSVASKGDLAKFRAAARATAIVKRWASLGSSGARRQRL